MKKALILAIAALAVPSVALAAKPDPSGKGKDGGPNVMYVLDGKLSAYTPYPAADASITIVITASNGHGEVLVGQALTFPLDASTKISLANGLTSIADDDNGTVKISAPKNVSSRDLDWILQANLATQVIDAGQ